MRIFIDAHIGGNEALQAKLIAIAMAGFNKINNSGNGIYTEHDISYVIYYFGLRNLKDTLKTYQSELFCI